MSERLDIIEVGLRDGFQSVGPLIPTDTKIAFLRKLHEAGVRRVEATSFVSAAAVPQLADAAEIVAAARALPDLDAQVLVPTVKQAERALQAGAQHLAFVLSVSESHNRGNVRRSPTESTEEYGSIIQLLPATMPIRLNVATAFDCPHEGQVAADATLRLLDRLVSLAPRAEIALCDTTGRVTPNRVCALFETAFQRFPEVTAWAFHGHDTYGHGVANALAAWHAGVRAFDASVSGLGGCPFAPGATGNVATEDLLWMFEGMGLPTGVDLSAVVAVAVEVAKLPGAQTGGRVRDAMTAQACRMRLKALAV
jgi:hydroxymethylglutaryl-CoA lyase